MNQNEVILSHKIGKTNILIVHGDITQEEERKEGQMTDQKEIPQKDEKPLKNRMCGCLLI